MPPSVVVNGFIIKCQPFTRSINKEIKNPFISPQTSTRQHRLHDPSKASTIPPPPRPEQATVAPPRTLTGLQVAATGTKDIPSEKEGEQRDKETRLPLETGVAGSSTHHTGSFAACIAADWCVAPPTATLSDSKLRLLGGFLSPPPHVSPSLSYLLFPLLFCVSPLAFFLCNTVYSGIYTNHTYLGRFRQQAPVKRLDIPFRHKLLANDTIKIAECVTMKLQLQSKF